MPWFFITTLLTITNAQNLVFQVPYVQYSDQARIPSANEVISIPVQNTQVDSAQVQSTGLPFKILASSHGQPSSETREATKNTLDRINKGYGSVLSVFKRNAAFKRSEETATTNQPKKEESEQNKRNLIPSTNNDFLTSPSLVWGKRGFWSSKSNWFKNPENSSDKPTFLVGKIPKIRNSVAKIPVTKRASMVENENMSKHPKRSGSNYNRPDYMPLFRKRYAFEAGGNHGYGDEEMYKRSGMFSGRNKNLIQLATSMSQKRSGSWRQDPRAGFLLMKGMPEEELALM